MLYCYSIQVTEIDDGLLQLKNLKQLTLSANLIRNIDSKRLPKGLEVCFTPTRFLFIDKKKHTTAPYFNV